MPLPSRSLLLHRSQEFFKPQESPNPTLTTSPPPPHSPTRMAYNTTTISGGAAVKHPKKQPQSTLAVTLFFVVLFTIPALFLLRSSSSLCSLTSAAAAANPRRNQRWSGDLRDADFAWNRLQFADDGGNLFSISLKIAVFSRKWPAGAAPGGMERHAHTLHSALARRGHRVHVFTSPPLNGPPGAAPATPSAPTVHYHEGEPGRWRYNKAWDDFTEENRREAFDIIHSESVALPYWLARHLPNLAVSWHGIALESLHSDIYQDLARHPGELVSPSFNASGVIPKVLAEIRFFRNYAHHVAISDSCGEMLRDVYQIPGKRVHVILNGVDESDFEEDPSLGREFRSRIELPRNATLVLGVAGRLVKDKGHPLLHEAFSRIIEKHHGVYLIIAGSGPWEHRYRDLGSRVKVLGSMNPAELRGFYNAIDVFVNPTLRPQGLDLTLMESMMAAKPVMASRFPSIKGSILVDEEFGFMFAPNVESLTEALEAAVGEGAARMAERGRACRKYAAEMFTARRMALAYERLFLCIKGDKFCAYNKPF